MADTARGKHVSPGIYTAEQVMTNAVKALGITTLGMAGETQKGPAFQVMHVSDWNEYQSMFGGTSAEKYKGNGYPKYELPYIAKSYLNESKQLEVVRVLGLSGYNAGPAWIIKASNGQAIAVLRSRGTYKYVGSIANEDDCDCKAYTHDVLKYYVGEVASSGNGCTGATQYNMSALHLIEYENLTTDGDICAGATLTSSTGDFNVSIVNHGRFTIEGYKGNAPASGTPAYNFKYPVSLNPADNDYILKVLGASPTDGDAPIYVESLYDVALTQGISSGDITAISSSLEGYKPYQLSHFCGIEPVDALLTIAPAKLSRRLVGRRYLAASTKDENGQTVVCYPSTAKNDSEFKTSGTTVSVGTIYTVAQHTNADGSRKYYYVKANNTDVLGTGKQTLVKNLSDGLYYRTSGSGVSYVSCDLNDYRSAYRYASTPWFVSNLKGDANKVEVNKLFRFHTISDGTSANNEVKVSIENILPDEGLFDVVIRDINDSDSSTVILEKYSRCSMVPGESNYIAYRIGSFDGVYESKSRYVTVEVNDSTVAKNSVPAGFMGYPTPRYNGLEVSGNTPHDIKFPVAKYNLRFDEDIKNKRQYFGLSDLVGIDIDTFTFKGRTAYIDSPSFVCQGFHLDSRVNKPGQVIYVDGQSGYTFLGVSTESRTNVLSNIPVIATEEEMYGSIYEYKNLRKFTAYFYGGFDGWDEYRTERTNTDEYKLTKYRGFIDPLSGEGNAFDYIRDAELLNLNQRGITSDWYAYLSAIRQFANPSTVDINVFATPGIDMINNSLLVKEAIDMIEDERADSIYIATMPDKPAGSGDFADEMYTAEDVTDALDSFEYDSNYTATYYPWVKYEDKDNSQYIYLPPTKDVVRNLAQTDNSYQPWFAPAGVNRGTIDGVRTKKVLKLSEEDELYEHGINPIKTFSTDGTVKVWGQKTIQIADNQLNRIATRRLLLRLRKLIAIATIGLIFDPNDPTTAQSLRSAITPILDETRSNRGISDYKLVIDDSVEMRENYELGVTIFIKPYTQLEYISINFILTPQGVSFEDI